jgi:hypothetical protein
MAAPAPVAATAPAAIAVPTAAPAPARTPVANESSYESKAERLRTLKRLRDDNLISETEYQEKREAIMKTL